MHSLVNRGQNDALWSFNSYCFLRQQWLNKCALMIRFAWIACLVNFTTHKDYRLIIITSPRVKLAFLPVNANWAIRCKKCPPDVKLGQVSPDFHSQELWQIYNRLYGKLRGKTEDQCGRSETDKTDRQTDRVAHSQSSLLCVYRPDRCQVRYSSGAS